MQFIMNEVIDELNHHYKCAFKEGTQLHFYQHVYSYIEIILNNPILSSIISEQAEKLKKELNDIIENPLISSKLREELLERAKNYSVYSSYFNLYTRVYLPILDNNNDVKLNEEMSNNLFYVFGIEDLDERQQSTYKWSFDNHINKAKELFTFLHTNLIPLIEQNDAKKIIKKKDIDFSFDSNTGKYKYRKTEGTLSPKTKEYIFINALYLSKNHQANYEELLGGDIEKASKYSKKVLADTVRDIKRKLNILPKEKGSNPNIIKNVSKYGYKLDI